MTSRNDREIVIVFVMPGKHLGDDEKNRTAP